MGTPASYRWIMITLGFMVTFTEHLLLFSHSTLTPLMMADMKLDFTQASFIFSLGVLVLTVSRIPWGLLCDRLGLRVTMGVAVTITGTFGFLRSISPNYEMLLLFQILLGIGLGGIMPALSKLVANWFPREELGTATGIYITGFSIGNMIGLGFTPIMLSMIGNWRNVLQVYGAWGLILALLWWMIAREGGAPRSASSTTPANESLSLAFRSREVWILIAFYLFAGGVYDTTCVWLPSSLELSGTPLKTAGLIATMLPVGNLLAGLLVGKLSDAIGLRRPFLLVLSIISGPALFLAWTASGAVVWGSALVVGFSLMGILSITLTVPVESNNLASNVGGVIGVITSVGNVNSFLMPIAAGFFKDVSGTFFITTIMLSLMVESMVFFSLILKETGKRTI